MKTKSTLVSLSLSIAAFAADLNIAPLDHRLIVSPFLAGEERKAFLSDLGDYLEGPAAPLTTVTVFDGIGLREVGRCTVPKLANDSALGRSSHYDDLFGKLDDFFDSERYRKDPQRGRAGLRVPEAIAEVAQGATASSRIVIYGSITYADGTAEELGFKNGSSYTVPHPSVLRQTPVQSPFGTVTRPSLGGATVWIKTEEPFPHGEAYKHQVEDFYRRWIAALQGELIRLTADGPSIFREIRLRVPPVTKRIEAVPAKLLERSEAPPVQSELVTQVKRELDAVAGDAEFAVAIGWLFDADLDLHWIYDGRNSVCYRNKARGPAAYLGDKTVGGRGYEIIKFSAVPDAATELWINVFAAGKLTPTPRTGVVIFRHRGREVEKRFTLSATTTGNGNGNIMGREIDAENWLKLDWKAALGLP